MVGEDFKVKLIKPGENPGQGVGYLADGTMVVIDAGKEFIGQEITATVTSTHQTSAGRMIFGKVKSAGEQLETETKNSPHRSPDNPARANH